MGRRRTILPLFLISISILSLTTVQPSFGDDVKTNFELLLITQAGSRIRESYAFFIRYSLAPLGIDVSIQAKPYGQYVGDLIHTSNGQPFDLLITDFEHAMQYPEFSWQYHSDSSIGREVYQLDDEDVQSSIEQDTGVKLSDIDDLLSSIDNETDVLERRNLVNQFTDIYMDKLIFDLPLTTVLDYTSMWKGFGDDGYKNTSVIELITNPKLIAENDLWNPAEGFFRSRMLGATWNPKTTPQTRTSQLEQWLTQRNLSSQINPFNALKLSSKMGFSSFNPYLIPDKETRKFSQFLTSPLLQFDEFYHPHPSIAYNFITEDWIPSNSTGAIIRNGKVTFLLNADQKWKFNKPESSQTVTEDNTEDIVDANDFALVLELIKSPYIATLSHDVTDIAPFISHWELNSTIFANDTLTVFLTRNTQNDMIKLGNLTPLPSHLLGGDLHLENGSTYSFSSQKINPLFSEEWQQFDTDTGYSLAGPMQKSESIKGEYFSFLARPDYPFPNEWDAVHMYEQYPEQLANYSETIKMDYFAPHLYDQPPDAYYWSFSGENYATKTTSQGIEYVTYLVISDDNAARIAFEAGQLDAFKSSIFGAATIKNDEDDRDYVVKGNLPKQSPYLLVFNLRNEYLQKRDIRYAIVSVIDREEMTNINDGFSLVQYSPVWRFHDIYFPEEFIWGNFTWYNSKSGIPFDYTTGRDMMRALGYDAMESLSPTTSIETEDWWVSPTSPNKINTTTPEKPDVVPYPFYPIIVVIPVIYSRLKRERTKSPSKKQ